MVCHTIYISEENKAMVLKNKGEVEQITKADR